MTVKAIIHHDPDGLWAEVPSMPGCFTQAESMDELVQNLREAIECWLSASEDDLKAGENAEVLELAL